jgi:hypothetical protein
MADKEDEAGRGEPEEEGSAPPQPGSARSTEPDGRSRPAESRPGQASELSGHGDDEVGRLGRDNPAYQQQNLFYGSVTINDSVVGTGDGDGTRPQRAGARTGKVSDDDLRDVDKYIRPDPFGEAADALGTGNVVVICGPAGIGKEAGAISLLRGVTPRRLYRLTPTLSLSDLAERSYEAEAGYVLADWQHKVDYGKETDFNWRLLRDQVRDAQAHLVITSVSARPFRGGTPVRCLQWTEPALDAVLSAYLGGTPAEHLIPEITKTVPADWRIGPVVDLARKLADGRDPDTALAEFEYEGARQVEEWFAADHPLTEILEVLALAFMTGRTERSFEAALAHLEEAVKDAGYALEPSDKDPLDGAADRARPLRARRAGRDNPDGLIKRERIAVEGSSRYVMAFRVRSYRQHVLTELARRYDWDFWNTVRGWLNKVIAGTTGDDSVDTQFAVADGLSALAAINLDEVDESYLRPWAGGAAELRGQLAAINGLWCMCFNNDLAPVALRIARDWATQGNPQQRWTAAIAFSGVLGVRYPTEATNQLWQLIMQAKGNTHIILALGQLFAMLTYEGHDAEKVLILLDRRVAQLQRGVAATRESWRIRLSVLAVLSARDPRSGQPAITAFLHANQNRLDMVARLWVAILCHRPMRQSALTALLDSVSAFEHVSDDPETHARAMGDALAAGLPDDEQEALATEISNRQARPKAKRDQIDSIVRALLAALERVHGSHDGGKK